ncbi:MAG TPA: NAD(P)H-hydrate dehydratase [Marmoricola sp.]|nr:NAD(P)H-hydrate dehydratase [Marmoricola sp.]
MRSAHTVEQVRALEAVALAQLPEGALMQRAAAGLAAALVDYLGGCYGVRILLIVGPGDNGGDALCAGAMLARRGAQVEAFLLRDNKHLNVFTEAGGRLIQKPTRRPDVIVDGVTGIGGRPGLDDRVVGLIAELEGVPIVAVDVPSGVGVDSGESPESHVRADLTVTFGTHKPCHLVDPAALACGVVHLVDLGLDLPEAPIEALAAADVAALLTRPTPDAHKYTRGVVGLHTGSSQYPGAAVLSTAGAASGICGMVRYLGPAVDAVRSRHPQVVVGEGRVQALVVGSGSGDQAETAWASARDAEVPAVIDADALRFVEGPQRSNLILTPHAGELSAMLDVPRERIERAPLRFAREAAGLYGCVVVLKGRRTIIAEETRSRVTTTGTPWLAVAGSGDVLGGVIGALAASGLSPFDAASVGSWLHGAAATLASAGGPLTPQSIAQAIPAVVRAEVGG